MNQPVNVATAAVRQVLAILERASDTWHNGDPADSGPLHWPIAVDLARRELRHTLGALEPELDERTQDARGSFLSWHGIRCG